MIKTTIVNSFKGKSEVMLEAELAEKRILFLEDPIDQPVAEALVREIMELNIKDPNEPIGRMVFLYLLPLGRT